MRQPFSLGDATATGATSTTERIDCVYRACDTRRQTMLELLEMQHSPYCIPIVRMLEGCSIPFKRREIPNWDRREIGELTEGKYYQVPVLVDGGSAIHDLPDDPYRVARHIDAHHCGGAFFLGNGQEFMRFSSGSLRIGSRGRVSSFATSIMSPP